MFSTSMSWSPDRHRRTIDARWQRAVDLAEYGVPDVGEDDWICRAATFLVQFRQSKTEAEKHCVRKGMPDIAFAIALHENPDRMVRAVPEARFLAGQTIEDVAAACKMPVAGIAAYEALFYCVMDRLQCFASIATQAFGKNIHDGSMTMDDRDVMMKLLAYKGGPVILDDSLDYFLNGLKIPASIDGATPQKLERLVSGLKTHAIFVMQVMPFREAQVAHRFMALANEISALLASPAETGATATVDVSKLLAEIRDLSRPQRSRKKSARRSAGAMA